MNLLKLTVCRAIVRLRDDRPLQSHNRAGREPERLSRKKLDEMKEFDPEQMKKLHHLTVKVKRYARLRI